jgi:hypothetical protein
MEAESEFRAAIERALTEAGEDERIGPRICAAHLRLRFEFVDLGLQLSVATTEDQKLERTFGDVAWEPKLVLSMTSEVANRYLLGRENLAIAIARGKIQVRGESRIALLYLPAAGLISEPYQRVVQTGFPQLATA